MSHFQDLLYELGERLDIQLQIDFNQACSLNINQSIDVQIELSSTEETILLMSMISELPPGRFRGDVLKDALKANFLEEKKNGYLSYIERENALTLLQTVYIQPLSSEALYDLLVFFSQRALKWKEAIESGHTSPEGEFPKIVQKGKSIFGFN